MNFWPFSNNLEHRQQNGYSDVLIAALINRAQGHSLALPSATSALEACAGLTGRGFASAEVSGPDALTRALTPGCLELVGRSLIRNGEVVFLIDTSSGNLRLIPAETHDIEGGPSRTVTYDYVGADSVLHFRYASDAARPWRGNGPVQVAALAGKLSAETVRVLADESSGPIGRLLGIPVDGDDATVSGLKADIANARGKVALLESGDWGAAGGDAKVDLKAKRFGAEPPQSLVNLADLASKEIYAACGFNAALWGGAAAASVREAWRLALFGVLAPLGRLVEAELQDKLDDDIALSWGELRASDLSGRARSLQSLVGAGLPLQAAAKEAIRWAISGMPNRVSLFPCRTARANRPLIARKLTPLYRRGKVTPLHTNEGGTR